MGLKWCTKLYVVQKRCPISFSRSSMKFEGHMDRKTDDLNPTLSKITRLVAAIKSLRFACFPHKHIDGLVQERHNSIANALELCLPCTNHDDDRYPIAHLWAWDMGCIHEFEVWPKSYLCSCAACNILLYWTPIYVYLESRVSGCNGQHYT